MGPEANDRSQARRDRDTLAGRRFSVIVDCTAERQNTVPPVDRDRAGEKPSMSEIEKLSSGTDGEPAVSAETVVDRTVRGEQGTGARRSVADERRGAMNGEFDIRFDTGGTGIGDGYAVVAVARIENIFTRRGTAARKWTTRRVLSRFCLISRKPLYFISVLDGPQRVGRSPHRDSRRGGGTRDRRDDRGRPPSHGAPAAARGAVSTSRLSALSESFTCFSACPATALAATLPIRPAGRVNSLA